MVAQKNRQKRTSRTAHRSKVELRNERSVSHLPRNLPRPRPLKEKRTHDVANLEWQPALFPPLQRLDLAHERRREECRVRVVCGLSVTNGGEWAVLHYPRDRDRKRRTERQARVEPKVEHYGPDVG